MSSSTTDLQNLELEVLHLTRALSKLKRNTPEWSFLNQKLEAAEEELEGLRGGDAGVLVGQWNINSHDDGDGDDDDDDDDDDNDNDDDDDEDYLGYRDAIGPDGPANRNPAAVPTPSPSSRTNVVWTSRGEYKDHPDPHRDDAYGGDEGGNNERALFDNASFKPVRPPRPPTSPRNRRKFSRILASRGLGGDDLPPDDGKLTFSEGYDVDAAIPKAHSGRRNGLALAGMAFAVALSCIVVVALSLSGNPRGGVNKVIRDSGHESIQQITEPCASFSMHLVPDEYGNETSWEIVRYDDDTVVLAGGPYAYKRAFDAEGVGGGGSHYEMVHATTCLPRGSYGFILYDSKGDGICCSYGRGEYGINLSRDRVVRPLSPGIFEGEEEVTRFQVAEEDIDVRPAGPPPSGGGAAMVDEVNIEDTPEGPCASFSMHLIPDQFGNETSWKIRRYDGVEMSTLIETHEFQKGTVVLQGGPYQYKKEFDREAIGSHYEMIHAKTCLAVGTYTFILYDSKGDGICCSYGRGEYGINLSKGRVIRPLSSGRFSGAGEVTPFEVTTADIDVLPELTAATAIDDEATRVPSELLGAEDTSGNHDVVQDLAHVGADGAATDPDDEPCASFSLHLVPDQFGNETSWKVLQKVHGDVSTVGKGGGRAEMVSSSNDVPPTPFPSYFPTHSPPSFQMRFLRESTPSNNLRRGRRAQAQQPWKVVLQGGPYAYRKDFDKDDAAAGTHYNAIVANTCLPVGMYKFILYDAKGDGICCFYGRGEYGINLSKGRVVRPLLSGEFMGVDEVTPFEVTAADIDVFPEGLPPAGANGNDRGSSSASSSSSLASSSSDPTSVPDTTENNNNPIDTIGMNDPLQVLPTNGPPVSSINSLTSLVTVSTDGSTSGRGKSYGILFDVETSPSASPMVIKGMELYLDTYTETHYEVWTKLGSWQDVSDAKKSDYKNGFRQISHGSITGKGSSDFTEISLNDFQDVELPAGDRQAFYVTLSDNNLVFKSYQEDGIGHHEMETVVQAGKDEFKVYYGAAIRAYPLDMADPVTDFWYNAGFLGRLWYKKNDR